MVSSSRSDEIDQPKNDLKNGSASSMLL